MIRSVRFLVMVVVVLEKIVWLVLTRPALGLDIVITISLCLYVLRYL